LLAEQAADFITVAVGVQEALDNIILILLLEDMLFLYKHTQ
jgi:hypothetical protein